MSRSRSVKHAWNKAIPVPWFYHLGTRNLGPEGRGWGNCKHASSVNQGGAAPEVNNNSAMPPSSGHEMYVHPIPPWSNPDFLVLFSDLSSLYNMHLLLKHVQCSRVWSNKYRFLKKKKKKESIDFYHIKVTVSWSRK